VHVPKDFAGLGTQLQLFATASSIFFGSKSFCTEKLNQLLLLVACNKKPFRDQIALNEFFAAKFLFAVDWRVQRSLDLISMISENNVGISIFVFRATFRERDSDKLSVSLFFLAIHQPPPPDAQHARGEACLLDPRGELDDYHSGGGGMCPRCGGTRRGQGWGGQQP
jgi:hypothetical protein